MDKIRCIYCGKEFEINEALREHIKSQELSKLRKEHKRELDEYRAKLIAAENTELELRRSREIFEEEKQKFELEKQRAIDEARDEIRKKAYNEAEEIHKFKEKEKDITIDRLKKALEDAQRKVNQGSQQTQGEVLELELERILKENFPNDDIKPVEKGVSGADIMQVVKSPSGKTDCGIILWESKRTKNWSDGWITKLRDDTRKTKANISVIVSVVLPENANSGIAFIDGVWVCKFEFAQILSFLLRDTLLKVAYQKTSQLHQGRKADLIYDYITSHEFRQQVEAILESYNEMNGQIIKERIVYEKIWKNREQQLKRIMLSTANIYGGIQGLAGSNTLPKLKGLELSELESGD